MAKVKIDRIERKIAHECFPKLIAFPVASAASAIDWMIRIRKGAFTPGEEVYLRQCEGKLRELSNDLHKIYFRLKH